MQIETALPYIALGLTVVVNISSLAYFLAKMSTTTQFHAEKLNEVRRRFDDHAANVRLHQDVKTQEIQLDHIDKRLTSLETEMRQMRESVTQRMDELHRTIIEGQ